MTLDRPVGSISGQQEWEWNRWQAERRSGASGPTPAPERRSEARRRERRERDLAAQREIAALEAELERRDRHLQDVIDHYEALLKEKNRQLRGRERSDQRTEKEPTVLSRTAVLSGTIRSYWETAQSYWRLLSR